MGLTMETIESRVNSDLKTAIMARDTSKKSILRVLIGEFNRIGKSVTDEQALSIIAKLIINAKTQDNEDEAKALQGYMPKQLDELELKRVLMNYTMNMSPPATMKDMGKVMSYLKENYNGQYDGRTASTLVRELLA